MDIRLIRSAGDHAEALAEIERLWGAPVGSPEGDKLDVLATLVEAYEEKRWPIDAPSTCASTAVRLSLANLVRQRQL